MPQIAFKDYSPAAKLAVIYLIFSMLWILLSDEAVTSLHRSEETTERLQNAKGLTFVFLSAVLLYVVSRRLYQKIQTSLQEKSTALAKLMALQQAAKEAIVDYDFTNDSAQINDQMQALLGVNKLTIKNFETLHRARVHPDDRRRVGEQFEMFALRNDTVWQTEYRYLNSEGQYRDMISRGNLIRDEKTNKPLTLVLALQDVTEIKQANTRIHLQQLHHRQELARHILEAQEIERNRWAQELHDNVCQVLTVAKLYQEHAAGQYGQNPFQEKAQAMVVKAINDIRQISALIKPPTFSDTTLTEAITSLFSTLERFDNTAYKLSLLPEVEDVLSEGHKVLLYRVIQEGLNNTVKYAAATEVSVEVDLHGSMVDMRLCDNGKGFSPKAVSAGIGLQNIRSRLQAFAGQLMISSSPGGGCELRAQFFI